MWNKFPIVYSVQCSACEYLLKVVIFKVSRFSGVLIDNMAFFEHSVLHFSWETVLFICLTDISFNKYCCLHLVFWSDFSLFICLVYLDLSLI